MRQKRGLNSNVIFHMNNPTAFKFREINKQMIESLITGEVYFSVPEKLNDPFDCQIDIKKSLDNAINLVNGEEKKFLEFLKKNLDEHFSRIEIDIKSFGVWSCSMTLENPLMWAHYSDEHRGICLAYELPDHFINHELGEVLGIHPVEYMKNPITDWFVEKAQTKIYTSFSDFAVSLIIKLLTSKDECWQHEKEGRVISKTAGIKEIGKPALKQICFGLRTSSRDKDLVKRILDNQGYEVTLCEIVRDNNDYGLKANEI